MCIRDRLYNIVRCKSATIGKIIEKDRGADIFGNPLIDYLEPQEVPGDGTVPLESSTNLPVDTDKKYYALNADHGKMLSQSGIRQQIVNIIAGTSLDTENKITQDINLCKLKGKAVAIYSPLDIEVIDRYGNRLGFASDGSLENNIPGADFNVFGEHKFAFLPEDSGEIYSINLKGTGVGAFTLSVSDIENSQTIQKQNFINVSVNNLTLGNLSFNEELSSLQLDIDGDGIIDQTLAPTSVLNPNQSQDLFSPETQAVLTGTQGIPGFYRSDVNVSFNATDEVLGQDQSHVSGVLKTLFSLDGLEFQEGSTTVVTTEGAHTVDFYSVDKAGNKETVKQITFTIDKTAPEVQIQFNTSLKDLEFKGLDNISSTSAVSVLDSDNIVTLEDEAGNKTKLEFKEKGRRVRLKAELKSIIYNNNTPIQLSNKMSFFWLYQKQDLKLLSQYIKSKNDFNILSVYLNNKTTLVGKDQNGKIRKTLPGLSLLKVTTDKGEFNWAY